MKRLYQKFVSYETQHDLYFKLFISILVLFIFVPIKKVYLSPISFTTGQYSDFTTYTLYLFDLVSIIGLLCFMWNNKKIQLAKIEWILFVAILLLPLFHVEQYRLLEYYYAIRLTLYIAVAGMMYGLIHAKPERFMFLTKLLLILSSFEVLIGLIQFLRQSSVGLQKLGESILAYGNFGIAKVVSHGTTIIRPYALFPHPNILSSVLSFSFLLSLINKTSVFKNKKLTITIQILLLLGIILCVSRGTILGLLLGLGVLSYSFARNKPKVTLRDTLASIGVVVFLTICIWPLFSTRNNLGDNSLTERVSQYQTALIGIKNSPIVGVGQGTSLLHVEQWGNIELKPWEKQPIHNYFLLNMAEIGIPIFILLIYALFIREHIFWAYLRDKYKMKQGISLFLVLPSFIAITMMFDHYYSTSPVMIALLWILMRSSQAYLTSPYGTPAQK